MSPAVVVVGSYVQDLTWRCGAFPREGETVVGQFATGPGGKGSNQAVAAARAGAATCFIGAVGRDPFAASARAFYRGEGIAARFSEKPRHATGTAAILVDASGQNEIVVALGANAALARSAVDPKLIQRARVVVTQLESNLGTAAHVLRLAKRAGVTTILNPAPMRPDFDPAMLRHVDVLIPNEAEFVALAKLTGATGRNGMAASALRRWSHSQLHAACRRLGVPTVIVTLGARGCFVSGPEAHVAIAGHRDVHVVDTTGAGDAFVGAFAAGLVEFSGDQVAAARFANAAAALSVTKRGTAPAMPRAAKIAQFLRRAGAISSRSR
jgi:ribokinase